MRSTTARYYVQVKNALAAMYQAAAVSPATSGSLRQPAAATAATVQSKPPAADASAPMTSRDVIDLRAAGLDDENLLAAIKSAKAVQFDLTPAGLKLLLNSNVSNRVIAAMRARSQ